MLQVDPTAYFDNRVAKLKEIEAKGIPAYPHKFQVPKQQAVVARSLWLATSSHAHSFVQIDMLVPAFTKTFTYVEAGTVLDNPQISLAVCVGATFMPH